MNELFSLNGKLAMVTGSSQGIGYAIARGLGRAGAEVILNGRRADVLAGAVAKLQEEGIRAHGCEFDVTDSKAVAAAVEKIEKELGPVEILVNNAGIHRRAPLLEMTEAQWREVIETNLTSVFLVSRAVAKGMVERRRGKIINICSLQSEIQRPMIANYAAAKGGLKTLTRAMTTEWASSNIQVNGIGPGYFSTELTRPLQENPEFNQWIIRRTPAGRWGDPEELVGAAIFLASPASSFVNGQILYVDGGILAAV